MKVKMSRLSLWYECYPCSLWPCNACLDTYLCFSVLTHPDCYILTPFFWICVCVWLCCRWTEGDQARHLQPPLWAPRGEVPGRWRAGFAHPATWRQVWQEHHEALTGLAWRGESGRWGEAWKGGAESRVSVGVFELFIVTDAGKRARWGERMFTVLWDRKRKWKRGLRDSNWAQRENTKQIKCFVYSMTN